MADWFVTRCRPRRKTSAGPLCVSCGKNLLVRVKGPTYFLCPHSLSVPRWLTDCCLALRTRRTVPSQLDPAKWPNRMDEKWGKKIKHQALETKNREKSHKGMCTRNTSCVPNHILAFGLLHCSTLIAWCTNPDVGSVVPNRTANSHVFNCHSFLLFFFFCCYFFSQWIAKTGGQKDSTSYVNQTHVTSSMPD